MSRDDWVYRIPRPLLDGFAATRTLDRTSQVLFAVICELYGEKDNSGNESPTGTATLTVVAKKTGRSVREVQKAYDVLYRAGVLFEVDSTPGRAKILGLKPGPKEATPKTGHPRQNGRSLGAETGVASVPKRAWVPTPETGHPTYKEQRNFSPGTSLQGTLDVTAVEGVHPSANGHNGQHAAALAVLDEERRDAITEILTDCLRTAERSHGLGRKAGERWAREWIPALLPLLVDRTALSTSTIARRARDFFRVDVWIRLGDSDQARHLREHMLRPVQLKRERATP